jgi:ribosome-binding ATPase YchF (GTP1/OBG family)
MTAESIKPKQLTTKTTRKLAKSNRKLTPKQIIILDTKTQHPDLTTRQIAAIAKTNHSNVIQCLARYGLKQNEITDYKSHRSEIFAGLQHKLLSSITTEDIQKTPVGSRILAACQIYDKERIELGKSTSHNIVLHESVERIQALRDKINLFDEGENDG